jgi:hypothetical protein
MHIHLFVQANVFGRKGRAHQSAVQHKFTCEYHVISSNVSLRKINHQADMKGIQHGQVLQNHVRFVQ